MPPHVVAMTALYPTATTHPQVLIVADYLLQKFPALQKMRIRNLTWNDLGEKIDSSAQTINRPLNAMRKAPTNAEYPEPSYWVRARMLVHTVFTSQDFKYEKIRKRLIYSETPSTPAILTTLSLWLAGELGISVSVTKSMVAVMLYAVSQSRGNWEILRC